MTLASGAQREPSMEEILASIRRIIEDSDGGPKAPGAAAASGDDAGSGASIIEVDAFRSELRGQPPQRLSMAEVKAMVEAQPEASHEPVASHDEPSADTGPTLADVSASMAEEASSLPEWPEMSPPSRWSEEASSSHVDELDSAAATLESVLNSEFENTSPAALPQAEPSQPEAAPQRVALMSEHAGKQVAAAFGELSEAFAARSRKTFDDMAAEMLRPMLQDWLDNNLPTLVERLVREEIERVARGAE